jgi:hypothetical protein
LERGEEGVGNGEGERLEDGEMGECGVKILEDEGAAGLEEKVLETRREGGEGVLHRSKVLFASEASPEDDGEGGESRELRGLE